MVLGANYREGNKCEFTVWAPFAKRMDVKLFSQVQRTIPMNPDGRGYWRAEGAEIPPGTDYMYVVNGDKELPDPASHFQSRGLHKYSQVVDHGSFKWEDSNWRGIDIADYIIYELHVGTFTPEGTFIGAIKMLDYLKETGITALELMPVAQFPGDRNWGYDGAHPYAVQDSYGRPDDLKKLVNECHKRNLAVILDVVYNHLGPEGNYLREFGPYFTSKYTTPWGEAINYDDEHSDEVRKYFIDNAIYWFDKFHFDALRLDAVHAIYDMSASHILHSLSDETRRYSRQQRRKYYLIAESDLNDTKVIRHTETGGYGIDSQWSDDFHHSVHALLTGERSGYYRDFGRIDEIVKSLKEGFAYDGRYSEYRKRSHGNSSAEIPADKFIVCLQNHDQVGNRMKGERLISLIGLEKQKLGAALLFFSPYIPMIFMGEEYGEENPFLYFVSHSDPSLIEAVRKGRREEFSEFHLEDEAPDPQSIETFQLSKPLFNKRYEGRHKIMHDYYKELIRIRIEHPELSNTDKTKMEVFGFENDNVLVMHRWKEAGHTIGVFNFNGDVVLARISLREGNWQILLNSADKKWGGSEQREGGCVNPDEPLAVAGNSIILLRKIGK